MARKVNLITKGTAYVGALLFGRAGRYLLLDGTGAPVDGTTGAGDAGPGSRYTDASTGDTYLNIGTKASPVWVLVDGVSGTRFVSVALTNANILALRATPFTLAAAPGAGLRWQLLGGTINLNNTGAYTESADNLAVRYVDGSGVIVSNAIETTGFVDQTGKIHTSITPKTDAIATEAQAVNKALVLHNTGDGEFGGGNAANAGRATLVLRAVPTL